MIFFDTGTIEIKEISPAQFILKEIGQLIRAWVERKISKDSYLIRFGKKSLVVKSKLKLVEGEELLLRVEALRPKVILKRIPKSDTNSYLHTIIKDIQKSSLSLLQLSLDPEHFNKEKFLDIFKKLLLDLKKEDLIKYLTFLKTANCRQQDIIYLFFPFFYYAKDVEFLFREFKKRSQKYVINIKAEFSELGPVRIFIEDTPSNTSIIIGVKDISVQRFLKEQLFHLADKLRYMCKGKNIYTDCNILPPQYLNTPLYETLNRGEFNFVV